MIKRRVLCQSGGIALLAAHRIGRGEAGARIRRVGILTPLSQASGSAGIEAFKQGMVDLGWREAGNVDYRIGYADGDLSRFDVLVAELLAQQVELIVVSTTLATRAAHNAAPSLPIVMTTVGDVVQSGFVASLARPGGSITGLSNQIEDLWGKGIELLHEAVPGARRIAVLLSGNSSIAGSAWDHTQRSCAGLGLAAQRVVAADAMQIPQAVEQIVRQRAQAVVVPLDGLFPQNECACTRCCVPRDCRRPAARARMPWPAGCSATAPTSSPTTATRRSTWTRF